MPAFLDLRPPGLALVFRPGVTLTLTFSWAAGSLAGRTFTSMLDAAALDVTVDGDSLVVKATAAQTAAVTVPAAWRLLEDRGGTDPEPVIIGTWEPSNDPNTRPGGPVIVTEGTATVTVTVQGGGSGAGGGPATAADLPFAPTGTITSDDVQAAIEEVAEDAVDALDGHAIDVGPGGHVPLADGVPTTHTLTPAGWAEPVGAAPATPGAVMVWMDWDPDQDRYDWQGGIAPPAGWVNIGFKGPELPATAANILGTPRGFVRGDLWVNTAAA